MDYPNSKKAKKVFLCLFVGDGGAQQVPKGLDGEEVDGDGQARFEKRREKFKSRGRDGKRKNIKDKDWILKKKEVRRRAYTRLTMLNHSLSYTANGARKACPEIQNILHGNEDPSFRCINVV